MSKKKHGGFELTDKQKSEIAQLELASLAAQAKRVEILRKAARESGVTAESLDELRTENGQPFVEVGRVYGGYRQAVSLGERAYFCRPQYMPEGPGCDWVIGEPVERQYDEIGVLAGSAGTRYYCRICGQQIGEFAMKHS